MHFFRYLIALFAVLVTLDAKTFQQKITPNVWQLVGVNGFHQNAAAQAGFISNGLYVTMKDTNDSADVMTYDRTTTNALNTVATPDTGDITKATVGLQVINGVKPLLTAVQMNFKYRSKNSTLTLRTMYISSSGTYAKPNIKIEYQSDYEGETFYLSIGDGNTYRGTFSSVSTYDNPQILLINSIKQYTKITEIFDMNLSDNDVANLDSFDVAGADMSPLSDYPDSNLTIYTWNAATQQWNVYRNENSASDFTELEAGRAYWVKLDSHEDINPGMILGEGNILGAATYQGMVERQWNLLSFEDSYLIDDSGGIFIDAAAYQNSGLTIRRGIHLVDTVVVPSGICDSDINVSAYINNAVEQGDLNGTGHWNLRAYPTTYPAAGIVLLSDEAIDINASATNSTLFKSIGEQSLSTAEYAALTSMDPASDYVMLTNQVIDEYMNAIQINKDLLLELPNDGKRKGALEISFLLGSSFKIDISAEATIDDIAGTIESAMQSVLSSGEVGTAAIDTDFDGESDTVVIAATSRFSVKDSTYTKVYEYNSATAVKQAYVHSDNGFNAFNTVVGDVQSTVDNINTQEIASGVSAYVIDASNNLLMLISHDYRDFMVIEQDEDDQFGIINSYEDNMSVRGAVLASYSIPQLAKAPIFVNDSAQVTAWSIEAADILSGVSEIGVPASIVSMTDDLGYMAYTSDDFSVDSPAYELAELTNPTNGLIIENVYTSILQGSYLYWQSSDITMDPSEFNTADNFSIKRFDRTKGYWAYLALDGTSTLSISNITFSGSVEHYFNNDFSEAKYAVGSVENFFDKVLTVTVNGLDSTTDSSVYRAEIIIDGKKKSISRQGTTSLFITNLNSFETEGLSVRAYPSLNKSMKINVYDGLNKRKSSYITTFNTIRPDIPTLGHLDGYGSTDANYLTIDITSGSVIKVFEGNISDYSYYHSNNLMVSSDSLSQDLSGSYLYNPVADGTIVYGTASKPYYDFRVIVANDDDLWSDMRRIYYAPVYLGTHILEDTDVSTVDYDSEPMAFDITGDNPSAVLDGNGDPIDSGVQLRVDDANTTYSTTLTMAYKPKNITLSEVTPYTAYLSDTNATDGQVAVISYAPEYEGTVFYIYNKITDQIFYGVFPEDATYNDPNNMYVLKEIDSDQTFSKP